MDKLFTAEFTDEAKEQANKLDNARKNKLRKAVKIFEQVGTQYKNINDLGEDLFELKPDDIRAYFEYYEGRVIIVGLVVLKKSQKAPKRFIEQARRNIKNHIKEYKS
ncbi:MAG: type II toxin-antitoxin system RelE/ParE family toxin [Heliobacteriaceae bacterium]|nr:type II toxin-antitoxin system RelE/ParE family toxin [Heliobacteriaceae bacterium]